MQTSLCSGLLNCCDCFDFNVVVQFGNPLKSNWGIYVRFLLARLCGRIPSEDNGRGYEHIYLFMFHLTMLSVTREQACVASYGRIFSEY